MQVFNPAFAARVKARRKAEAESERRAGFERPQQPNVRVAFTHSVSQKLREAARQREALPQVLAAALLSELIEQGLIDEVLAGRRPDALAGGQARRLVRGTAERLTLHQCGLIWAIATSSDDDGWCRLSHGDLARIASQASARHVFSVLEGLERRGLIAFGAGGQSPRPLRLTNVGRAVFDGLAQERNDDA